ncbi:hypothetical protein ACN4EK_22455 [Pantanalinema rosaneae CENA516]|uniref:hypothetical protein n=1 Tax=Pantanalinema rosaneae TaxID=1620701 RepID=UPI003D6DD518
MKGYAAIVTLKRSLDASIRSGDGSTRSVDSHNPISLSLYLHLESEIMRKDLAYLAQAAYYAESFYRNSKY